VAVLIDGGAEEAGREAQAEFLDLYAETDGGQEMAQLVQED
jgi:hypothetical protein